MTADSVGARLREARTNHKLSLRSVAELTKYAIREGLTTLD